MKKLFVIFAIFVLSLTSANAADNSDKALIKRTLTELNKVSNEHNPDKIKTFYSKDYISHDGFSYDAFVVSIKETFKTYPDISYKIKIKSIDVLGDYAAVEILDSAQSTKQTSTQAIINNKPVLDQKLDGIMESKSHYVSYLKKTGGKWLIYSDNVITEETSIKYGRAKDIDMEITSPPVAQNGGEYCISLNIQNKPKDVIVLASLSREEIKYPPALPGDIFRKVPSDGTLERVVSANKNGLNEYSLASIGLTEISLNEERTAINYQMSGIAFLIKRVNINSNQNAVNKESVKKALEKELL